MAVADLRCLDYDPLLYSRHIARDRTVKVGREINKEK